MTVADGVLRGPLLCQGESRSPSGEKCRAATKVGIGVLCPDMFGYLPLTEWVLEIKRVGSDPRRPLGYMDVKAWCPECGRGEILRRLPHLEGSL